MIIGELCLKDDLPKQPFRNFGMAVLILVTLYLQFLAEPSRILNAKPSFCASVHVWLLRTNLGRAGIKRQNSSLNFPLSQQDTKYGITFIKQNGKVVSALDVSDCNNINSFCKNSHFEISEWLSWFWKSVLDVYCWKQRTYYAMTYRVIASG